MIERLRGLARGVGPRGIRIGAAVLLLVLLVLILLLVGIRCSGREVTSERATGGEEITVAEESETEDFPLLFGPGPSAEEPAEAVSADGRRARIPGLSGMDVVGELQHVPGTYFRCPGGGPAGGGLTKRTCTSSSDEDPAVYEVTLVEDDPRTVLSVTATARDAPDKEAAGVFGYVARLSIGAAGPLDPEAWVRRGISSGGQYFSNGAEVRLYGAQGARALEIVASPPPTAVVQSPETTDGSPETTDGPPR